MCAHSRTPYQQLGFTLHADGGVALRLTRPLDGQGEYLPFPVSIRHDVAWRDTGESRAVQQFGRGLG
jgi:hypothetical protein